MQGTVSPCFSIPHYSSAVYKHAVYARGLDNMVINIHTRRSFFLVMQCNDAASSVQTTDKHGRKSECENMYVPRKIMNILFSIDIFEKVVIIAKH